MSPEASFFQAGGTLSEDARCYIEREADVELLAALEKGELCLVLAPRQTGKSSLMVHAAARLRATNVRAGIVDLQLLGSQKDLAAWFADVAYQIERSLRLRSDSTEWWNAHPGLGATQRFVTFLEDVVLAENEQNVVIFLDEIDSVLGLPFYDDFFTTIRSMYNARAHNPTLRRLTFVLLGVATASSFIRNPARTPFNIGTAIELRDFDRSNTKAFREVLGAQADILVDAIFNWTGGQPLLVQKLAAAAYAWPPDERTEARISTVVRELYLQPKIEQDTHLKFIQDYLLSGHTNLRKTLATYRDVLAGREVPEDKQSSVHNHLKLAGVVRVENGALAPRNRIYTEVFGLRWVREHQPRDFQRYATWASSSALALILGAMFIIQPAFFPRFPDIPRIVHYTADTSFDRELQVSRDVSRAILTSDTLPEAQLLDPENGLVRFTLASLPIGRSTYELTLVGGLFDRQRRIPIEVVYYPRWEVRRFPDARLDQLQQVLIVKDDALLSKDVVNGLNRVVAASDEQVTTAALSRDRKTIVYGTATGTVVLQGAEPGYFESGSPIRSVALSDDSSAVLILADDGTATLLDARKLEPSVRSDSGESVIAAAVMPRGKGIVLATADGSLTLTRPSDRRVITLQAGEEPCRSLAISRDGGRVACGTEAGGLVVLGTSSGERVRQFGGRQGTVTALAFSPDGRTILSGDAGGELFRWGAPPRSVAASAVGSREDPEPGLIGRFSEPLADVGFSRDGRLVYGQDRAGDFRVWDAATGEELQPFSGYPGYVGGVAFSPNGNTILAVGEGGLLKVWDVGSGRVLTSINLGAEEVGLVIPTPDGRRAVVSSDLKPGLWDLETGELVQTFAKNGDEDFEIGIALSPDGRLVATLSEDTIALSDVPSGRTERTLSVPGGPNFVTFSPDGDRLVASANDSSVRLWDVASGELLLTFPSSEGAGLAFFPDGARIVSSENAKLRMWDLKGETLATFTGHEEAVILVEVSPNGQTLASGSEDDTLRLWDAKTGQMLRTFDHNADVHGIAFAPDGQTLVSGSQDGKLRLWWAALEPRLAGSDPDAGFFIVLASDASIPASAGKGRVHLVLTPAGDAPAKSATIEISNALVAGASTGGREGVETFELQRPVDSLEFELPTSGEPLHVYLDLEGLSVDETVKIASRNENDVTAAEFEMSVSEPAE